MTFFEGFSLRPHPSTLIPPDERHRRESFHPRAAQQLQEHGLSLVVLVVGERDVIGFLRKQRVITRRARCGLETVTAFYVHADHPQGYAAGTADRAAERSPAAGIGADLMIDVKRGKCKTPAIGDTP